LQNGFGVTGQGFKGGVGFPGPDELHQFDLFELVLADQAAGVLAVAAGLAAKTGGVAHVFHLQLLGGDDLVACVIGYLHYGGGGQV